jgi:hypothetical protein
MWQKELKVRFLSQRIMIRSWFIIIILIFTISCDKDNISWHVMVNGLARYPNGMSVTNFCAPWYYYHYYRSYCKSQKCLDSYDKQKPGWARIKTCQKEAAYHGADSSNFLTAKEIEELGLEFEKYSCRRSGEWKNSDPNLCKRLGIKKEENFKEYQP